MKPIVVIGAGVSGLTAASALQEAGKPVVVLERSKEVGGLARSLNLDGYVFDIGPHYFFLKTDARADSRVMECLKDRAEIFDFPEILAPAVGRLITFETGVRYQMYHALALIAVAWAATRWSNSLTSVAGWLFVAGTLIFSGSLYALSLTGARWLGAITPLGGVAFISGWLCLALAALRG